MNNKLNKKNNLKPIEYWNAKIRALVKNILKSEADNILIKKNYN